MKKHKLSLFLSRPGILSKECFDKENISNFKAEKIPLSGGYEGTLYVYKSPSEKPDWVDFLDEGLTSAGKVSLNSYFGKNFTVSGMLALEIPSIKRCAVFTFGHGRSLLSYESIEQFFGRNVVLNTVETDEILSIKSSAYQNSPRNKEDQASLKSNIYEFDLDLEYEILQKMTAELNEKNIEGSGLKKDEIGNRITGYDSVHLTTSLDLTQIEKICKWLEKKFKDTKFKTVLPDIDSFAPIKDETLINNLNSDLLGLIKKSKLDGLHLVIPGLVNYEEYQSFSFTGFGSSVRDENEGDFPSIELLLKVLSDTGKKQSLEIETLKKNFKILFISNLESNRNYSLSIYRCITGEIIFQGKTYAIMNGQWYLLDKDFYDRITNTLNKITLVKHDFDSFDEANDKDEAGYNLRHANKFKADLFDKNLISYRGKGKIEACDILLKEGHFVHVKMYSGSASLSHLFSQGFVSIKALIEDPSFLDKFVGKIKKNLKLKNTIEKKINERESEIHFVIVLKDSTHFSKTKKILNLPSFSVINLYRFYKAIKTMGYKMKIKLVF